MDWILQKLKSERTPWLCAAFAALLLGAVAVWWGALNQDEGWYLYAAQLVREGKLPYRDFFFTQGPALPYVYSALSPIWAQGSPLQGILGGRVLTFAFGLFSVLAAVALARKLVGEERRSLAGLTVFALLSCNLYHVYFTTIPKTYAIGGMFLSCGFLLIAAALGARTALRRGALAFAGGVALAFATGTRISLILILPVAAFVLLVNFRHFRWTFLWFGLGAAAGLMLTYGFFALDAQSRAALLAAQSYHAARGGFDPFFALGSLLRVVRGYLALVAVTGAILWLRPRTEMRRRASPRIRAMLWMIAGGAAAVFGLQICAPFPYDDYQVPVMLMFSVAAAVLFARSRLAAEHFQRKWSWWVLMMALAASCASPLLQEWAVYGHDRFWVRKKEQTDLAKLRATAELVNALDPGGKEILTQDVYLAIETGRRVPRGMEMGPFCFFPELERGAAARLGVLNTELTEELIATAQCPVAAFSGYAFAISAPHCGETPLEEQERLFGLVKRRYELVAQEEDFGQNATPLLIMKKREGGR